MVTKEVLQARIEELRVQHDQFLAQANACAGAMADCQYWIDRMAAEAAVPPAPPTLKVVPQDDEEDDVVPDSGAMGPDDTES